jgi:hypothetical protein
VNSQKLIEMELDELKQAWKQTEIINQTQNQNIMEMMQQSSTGPVAALKKAFRKQYRLIIIMALFVLTNLTHGFTSTNYIMFFSYAVFCAGLAYFFYRNYQMVHSIESMHGMVKNTISQQITSLESRLKMHMISVRIALLVFIALTEVLPYFQHGRVLDKWHAAPLFLRILVYVSLIVFQYFVSRSFSKRKFGQHLEHLKELIVQLQ